MKHDDNLDVICSVYDYINEMLAKRGWDPETFTVWVNGKQIKVKGIDDKVGSVFTSKKCGDGCKCKDDKPVMGKSSLEQFNSKYAREKSKSTSSVSCCMECGYALPLDTVMYSEHRYYDMAYCQYHGFMVMQLGKCCEFSKGV